MLVPVATIQAAIGSFLFTSLLGLAKPLTTLLTSIPGLRNPETRFEQMFTTVGEGRK